MLVELEKAVALNWGKGDPALNTEERKYALTAIAIDKYLVT